jgi:predicted signal transduction protein with EAL and GGDEF domain
MSEDSLIRAMPDIVVFVRPDGLITDHVGGTKTLLMAAGDPPAGAGAPGAARLAGRTLEAVFGTELADTIGRLVRRTCASREAAEAGFAGDSASYSVRVSPHGPERALCVIRCLSAGQPPAAGTAGESFGDRLRRIAVDAALRERPFALAIIFLDGLDDIGQLIDFSIRERVLSEMELRLEAAAAADGNWHSGLLAENLLGIVIEATNDRDRIQDLLTRICQSISQPLEVHGAQLTLRTAAGVAIFGRDASKVDALLDHARAAMLEARRGSAGMIHFYSDTVRMLPVMRIDIEREMRVAIGEGQIDMRYVVRHDLVSGAVVGIHAYMRWIHPLRGEIPPAQFLKIAAATNLSVAVSSAALERLAQDLPSLHRRFGAAVPVSFGALREHLASGQFMSDLRALASAERFASGSLELRIAERALTSLRRPKRMLAEMADFGARLVVDEFGGGFTSLARLPQLPLAALQIDRALVVAARRSRGALRSCRAIAALAAALDVVPIAAGIDDEAARVLMAGIGCRQGLGDLYRAVDMPATA